ncbi:MAG TPA: hypothetical protein VNC50_21750, partial [Planctomycetia bacterium]|nr:hypothetical protein [Planctomycetia bacterium]
MIAPILYASLLFVPPADAKPISLPAEVLVLPPGGGSGGRAAVAADTYTARIVDGSWKTPVAGGAVVGADGVARQWT